MLNSMVVRAVCMFVYIQNYAVLSIRLNWCHTMLSSGGRSRHKGRNLIVLSVTGSFLVVDEQRRGQDSTLQLYAEMSMWLYRALPDLPDILCHLPAP